MYSDPTESLNKKYYKIGEVSEMLGLPQSTLRYWERRFTILHPHRNAGGTRHYTPADIERLRMINYLVNEKGLRIEAAEAMVARNRQGISRRFEVIERLRGIRRQLTDILDAL